MSRSAQTGPKLIPDMNHIFPFTRLQTKCLGWVIPKENKYDSYPESICDHLEMIKIFFYSIKKWYLVIPPVGIKSRKFLKLVYLSEQYRDIDSCRPGSPATSSVWQFCQKLLMTIVDNKLLMTIVGNCSIASLESTEGPGIYPSLRSRLIWWLVTSN